MNKMFITKGLIQIYIYINKDNLRYKDFKTTADYNKSMRLRAKMFFYRKNPK